MPEIIGVSSWLVIGLLWGDWRNWRKYENTILFMILVDTLYYYATYGHRLWTLVPQSPLFEKELIALAGEFVVFASTLLIYLGRFPAGWKKGIIWTLLWIAIFTANEWILVRTGTFRYDNGWTLLDSVIFCCVMFPMLRLHQSKPLTAYLLGVFFIVAYICVYDIPIR